MQAALAAQQATAPILHISVLPSPDRRLAEAGAPHGFCSAVTLRHQQHDPCLPAYGAAGTTLSQVTENPVGYAVGALPSVPSTQPYQVPGADGVLTYAPHKF